MEGDGKTIHEIVDELRQRVDELEKRLGDQREDTLYSDNDIEIFRKNWEGMTRLLQDEQFLALTSDLVQDVNEEQYDRLFDYVRGVYHGFVVNICDSCNGLLFVSEKSYDPEIFTWNIGGRSEIILSLMSNAYHCTRRDVLQDLLNNGFGYSKRTKFIDRFQTDFTEYHFICKQLIVNNRLVFIVIREKI